MEIVNSEDKFGYAFERLAVSIILAAMAVVLIYLAVKGPLFLGEIRYKTAGVINNQLVGQDLVNLFLISPLLVAAAAALWLKKSVSKYLLMLTPLFLIYYALSYTIGWEWSANAYTGNNEHYTFHFLFILIGSLITLLYGLSVFPKTVKSLFKKTGLAVYSALFTLFLLVFASMWIQEVVEVMSTGTARAYDIAPTAFWLVRVFDLGFSIPLGLISVYLLWARPDTSYPVQFLFYGFFMTMIVAVNAMGLVMFFKNDPTFLFRDMIVFLFLLGIIAAGFVYVVRGHEVI